MAFNYSFRFVVSSNLFASVISSLVHVFHQLITFSFSRILDDFESYTRFENISFHYGLRVCLRVRPSQFHHHKTQICWGACDWRRMSFEATTIYFYTSPLYALISHVRSSQKKKQEEVNGNLCEIIRRTSCQPQWTTTLMDNNAFIFC